jgi:signal transduction histidine kinase
MFEDDGKGFDPKEVSTKKGIGLTNIQSRIKKLNGSFEIDSHIGAGVTFVIDIPIKLLNL